jgi:hypothetical protein
VAKLLVGLLALVGVLLQVSWWLMDWLLHCELKQISLSKHDMPE